MRDIVVVRALAFALLMVAVPAVLAEAVAAKPAGTGPGNAPNAKMCQKTGWQSLIREDGTSFSSEKDCTAYAAGGGALYNPDELPCLAGGWQDHVTSTGESFDGQSACVAYVREGGTLVSAAVIAPCLNGGWQNYLDASEASFAGEQACRSYTAGGGTLLTALEVCEQQLAAAGLSAPADANYVLGTSGDDPALRLTTANDVICGFGGSDTVTGDIALSAGEVFLGGSGNDRVELTEAGVDGGTVVGGDGDDSVRILIDGAFDGGDGNDSVTTRVARSIPTDATASSIRA